MKNLKKGFIIKKELKKKHLKGQKKYGAFSFIEDKRDMKLEACDELIDAVNYLVYEEIKKDLGISAIRILTKEQFNKVYSNKIKNITETDSFYISNILFLIKLLSKE